MQATMSPSNAAAVAAEPETLLSHDFAFYEWDFDESVVGAKEMARKKRTAESRRRMPPSADDTESRRPRDVDVDTLVDLVHDNVPSPPLVRDDVIDMARKKRDTALNATLLCPPLAPSSSESAAESAAPERENSSHVSRRSIEDLMKPSIFKAQLTRDLGLTVPPNSLFDRIPADDTELVVADLLRDSGVATSVVPAPQPRSSFDTYKTLSSEFSQSFDAAVPKNGKSSEAALRRHKYKEGSKLFRNTVAGVIHTEESNNSDVEGDSTSNFFRGRQRNSQFKSETQEQPLDRAGTSCRVYQSQAAANFLTEANRLTAEYEGASSPHVALQRRRSDAGQHRLHIGGSGPVRSFLNRFMLKRRRSREASAVAT